MPVREVNEPQLLSTVSGHLSLPRWRAPGEVPA